LTKPSQQTPWEYKLVPMGDPLAPNTEQRANAIGKQGWELAAIDAGVWIFKRLLAHDSAAALQALMDVTVPLAEPDPSIARA
jgi:hypothetical protein